MTFTEDLILHNVPTNPTNGDMIKKLFPNAEYEHVCRMSGVNYVEVKGMNGLYANDGSWHDSILQFYDEWWNAPYKNEVKT